MVLNSPKAVLSAIEEYHDGIIFDPQDVIESLAVYNKADIMDLLSPYHISVRNGDEDFPKVFEAYEPKKTVHKIEPKAKSKPEPKKHAKPSEPASKPSKVSKAPTPHETHPKPATADHVSHRPHKNKGKKRHERHEKKIVHSLKDEERKRNKSIEQVKRAIKTTPQIHDDDSDPAAKGMGAGSFDSGLN